MAFECRVEADSISPAGVRLTTMVVTFPRFILAEFNTHRALARNAASSRAIPIEKRIAAIEADPFIPEQFGSNRKGMQAGDPLDDSSHIVAKALWCGACAQAVAHARELASLGVHKQLANRLLEPFAWVTVVVTATDWANFFALRCHPDAQPEFQKIACMMRDSMAASKPVEFKAGWWHMPFVTKEELAEVCAGGELVREQYKWVSVGRCARVSYLTHDGRRDIDADVGLAERLAKSSPPHSSPFEHVATPSADKHRHRNFRGWLQMRATMPNDTVEDKS